MNRWECNNKDCSYFVVGCGGAIGLRAIGWYFEPGPILYCPIHRPDGTTKRSWLHKATFELHGIPDDDTKCSQCTGDIEAARWQGIMNILFGRKLHDEQVQDINKYSGPV